MKVQQIFFKNTLRNFSYVITFDDGAIYCIDPFNALEIKEYLGANRLSAIINTHDHCDHHSGNEELVSIFNCPVLCHKNALVPHKTRGLSDAEILYNCGDWKLESVDTPGHTLSHLCLLLRKNEVPYALFTGDSFFNAGVGNCHNGGDVNLLYQTIEEVISHFPDDLLIYPGHEYLKRNLEFTLSVENDNQSAAVLLQKINPLDLNKVFFINDMKCERTINLFLRLDSPSVRSSLGLEGENRKTVFVKLRELRNMW